jgi:hypothetical protein
MEKEKIKKIPLITGNKIIDGFIVLIIGLVLFGLHGLLVQVFGYPSEWWKLWGGFWSSIVTGFWLVLFFGGLIFEFVGISFIIRGIFERLLIPEKLLYLAIVYIPAMISLTLLALYTVIPPELYAKLFEWLVDKVLVFIVGALMGYLYAKSQ